MKKLLHFFFSLFFLICFGCNGHKDACFCCDKYFTNIEDAIACFDNTKSENVNSSDERLLLIAFVNSNVEANQKLGWEIIADKEIIEEAKKKYSLVILESSKFNTLNHDCHSLNFKSLKYHKNEPVFVITNQALCIFGTWTLHDNNEYIIDRLGIGNGP